VQHADRDRRPRHHDRLVEAGRSRAMVQRVVVSLGAILAAAMSYGKLARNIVRDQARNRSTRERRLAGRHKEKLVVGVDLPTKDEIRAILNAAQGSHRALIVTAVFTGLRASELRGLTWRDVDFGTEVLTVRQRADYQNTIGSPKSDAGKRAVPLAPLVVNTLKEWKLACPKGKANLVFPTRQGGVMTHTNLFRTVLGPVQLAAGITSLAEIRANTRSSARRGSSGLRTETQNTGSTRSATPRSVCSSRRVGTQNGCRR
jgi:integrase